MYKLWHQRLAFLGGIKPLVVECAVVRVGGKGGRTNPEVLVGPARPWNLSQGQWKSLAGE